MSLRRSPAAVALLAAATAAIAGCGSSAAKKPADTTSAQPTPDSAPVSFPAPKGRSLRQMLAGMGQGPMLAITGQVFEPGTNRFGFILVSSSRKQIVGAPAALYVQRSGDTKVTGPYKVATDQYGVKKQFMSDTVKSDPNAVSSIYLGQIKLPSPGIYAVVAVTKLDGQLVATAPAGIKAVANDPVPNVGDTAPLIQTPTPASVGGNLDKLDTRQPHDTMHAVNFADVYRKKPIVLLFSTPALCQSRACGPVTDVAQQVSSQYGKQAAFIHMEVYRDNTIKPGCLEGTRPESDCYWPQFIAYHLPSEPWVFGIDRKGKVAARIEGPFGTADLQHVVKTAIAH